MSYLDITHLIGKTLTQIDVSHDEIILTVSDKEKYKMYHSQDCCESVTVEDVNGDTNDLLNTPILEAYESTNEDNPPSNAESFTWTFYVFRTIKGTVTIRWLGESNGYYSESVDFIQFH